MSLNGQVVVVTGGTDGIGRQTALELAKLGARIIITGRRADKCAEAARGLNSEIGRDGVEFAAGDLSTAAGVEAACAGISQLTKKIDVLVNNAGAMFQKRETTSEGFEKTFALNHLGYFRVTHKLLPLLKSAPRGRIVNVASAAHLGARLDWENLQNERNYSGWVAYGQSKLANVYFTYALAPRLKATSITVNCLHPGFVASKFGDENGGWLKLAIGIAKRLAAISEEQGARTSVFLASSAEADGQSGLYFDKCKAVRSSPVSYDERVRNELWRMSERFTGLSFE